MKMLRYILLQVTLVLLLSSCSTKNQIPQVRVNEVANKIQTRNFSITVDYAHPQRGTQIYLNDNYDLTIRNDSAIAYLPYYGQAQVAPLNPVEGGIKFAEPIIDYKATEKKRQNGWDISFKVNAREYRYEFQVNIFNDGTSSFTVNSFQRDPIRFSGNFKKLIILAE